VTLRIEERSDGHHTILRLSGRIQAEHLEELTAHIGRNGPAIVLDLEDVTLVDVPAVRFLSICEAEGIHDPAVQLYAGTYSCMPCPFDM
jgi:hypothetical protein